MAQYIDKKELYKEILLSKEQNKLTKRAEELFILLAKETIKKMTYKNPDDRKDCLQEGLLVLFTRWHNFNPEVSQNVFAYYTEIFKRGMAQGLNKMYNKNMKNVSISSSNNGDGFFKSHTE
jgi:hypothetical protein